MFHTRRVLPRVFSFVRFPFFLLGIARLVKKGTGCGGRRIGHPSPATHPRKCICVVGASVKRICGRCKRICRRASRLGGPAPPSRSARRSLRSGVQRPGVVKSSLRASHHGRPLDRTRGPGHPRLFELALNKPELLAANVVPEPVLAGGVELPRPPEEP